MPIHLRAHITRCSDRPGHATSLSLPAGAVAALVAVLLREHGAPEGMGPVHSIGIGPASVMSHDLAERCDPFVTSLCLRSARQVLYWPCSPDAQQIHTEVKPRRWV